MARVLRLLLLCFAPAVLSASEQEPLGADSLPVCTEETCSGDDFQCLLSLRQFRGVKGQGASEAAQASTDSPASDIARRFMAIGSGSSPGGLMVHYLRPISDEILNGSVPLHIPSDVLNVRGFTRGSSWSYWRKDLLPTTNEFITPRVGLIVDANAVWELVDGMYAMDGATNARRACSRYQSPISKSLTAFKTFAGACAEKSLREAGVSGGPDVEIFLPGVSAGDTSPLCPDGDWRCRVVDAGGCMPYTQMFGQELCRPNATMLSEFASCFSFTESVTSQVEELSGSRAYEFHIGSCPACTSPYMCIAEDAPTAAEWPSQMFYNGTAKEFQILVGKDGRQWAKVFPEHFAGLGEFDSVPPAALQQCMFRKENFGAWVNAQHKLYESILPQVDTPLDGRFGEGLDNEVPVYIYPESTHQYLAQEELLLSAIVGIALPSKRTCKDYLGDGLFRGSNATELCTRHGFLGGLAEEQGIEETITQGKWLRDFLSKRANKKIPLCTVEPESGALLGSGDTMRAALSPQGVPPASFLKSCVA